MTLLWWWLACGGATGPETSQDTSAQPDASTALTLTDTGPETSSSPATSTLTSTTPPPYWGEILDPPLPAPSFSVLNQDGEVRTETWLDQGPTVLWFYRDAGTAS